MGISRFWLSLLLMITISTTLVISTEEEKSTSTQIHKRSGAINHHDDIEHEDTKSTIRTNSGRKITSTNNKNPDENNLTNNKKIRKNEELLHKIGLTKIKTPVINHHRKRLASQSRKSQPGDSHMFVIKLPPNPYYYAHAKPLDFINNNNNDLSPINNHQISGDDNNNSNNNNKINGKWLNNVGIDFNSNGKPSRIYHWNIPVMKKMMTARNTNGNDSKIKNKKIGDNLWESISEQSTIDDLDDVVHHKVSYYKPKSNQNKKMFHKYFNGNGKPHSFYVIDKSNKSKKPVSYHRLFP